MYHILTSKSNQLTQNILSINIVDQHIMINGRRRKSDKLLKLYLRMKRK